MAQHEENETMLILKMMTGTDITDDDARAPHRIMPVPEGGSVDFTRESGEAQAVIYDGDGTAEWFDVTGNCYLMNASGKTITSFSPNPLPGARPPWIEVNGVQVPLDAEFNGPCDSRAFIRRYALGHPLMAHLTGDGIEVMSDGTTVSVDGARYVTIPADQITTIADLLTQAR